MFTTFQIIALAIGFSSTILFCACVGRYCPCLLDCLGSGGRANDDTTLSTTQLSNLRETGNIYGH
ncbi:hypothetical protein K457DRAFT_131975 [Linnemannia elongata AG-77]|uniref:Uncharacterized protein n=1 Tax=Linnemannia elongata AG-77 TaxID=1314771 RepID=A0A197KJV3_9FUNG|nr:hypothetical protein K457DRAFT_131975 [Linnemannia elongata AG-77]